MSRPSSKYFGVIKKHVNSWRWEGDQFNKPTHKAATYGFQLARVKLIVKNSKYRQNTAYGQTHMENQTNFYWQTGSTCTHRQFCKCAEIATPQIMIKIVWMINFIYSICLSKENRILFMQLTFSRLTDKI